MAVVGMTFVRKDRCCRLLGKKGLNIVLLAPTVLEKRGGCE